MSTPLTPTQKKALAQLVVLRYCAKKTVQTKKIRQSNITLLTEIIDTATYQFPPTITSVAARAAFVSELVTAAEERAPWGMPLAKS